jgi:hypothetical protein
MFKNYSAMNEAERKAELRRLRDELDDREETFQFHMRNTSDHISSSVVAKGEAELEKLRSEIDTIEKLLSSQ